MDYKEKIITLLNSEELSQELREKLEGILSEFEESKDERMRKAILTGLIDCRDATDLGWSNFGGVNIDECIAWLEKQGDKDNQVTLPTFTFNDILALQCCMETVKKVQEDKDLYEKLNDLHSRIYDAYHLEKQGKQMNAEIGQSEVIKVSEQKLEPKFHPGDWIVDTKTPNDVFCVIGMLEKAYKVIDTDGVEYRILHCKVDKQFRLLTMITEDYCSSKVAKLLKEIGFNVPVWTYYEDEEDKDVIFGDKYDWNNSPIGQISAPTHQMVLKWLREVHKISIEIFACCDKNKDGKIWSYTICKIYDAANEIGPSTSYHKTYEEAVESALIYCLEKIL